MRRESRREGMEQSERDDVSWEKQRVSNACALRFGRRGAREDRCRIVRERMSSVTSPSCGERRKATGAGGGGEAKK